MAVPRRPPPQPGLSAGLQDARAKAGWGRQHVRRYRELWDQLYPLESDPVSVDVRLNTARDAFVLMVAEVRETPDLITLTVDAVHNLRSGLDYLTWSLAKLNNRGREPRSRSLMFPVARDADHFRSAEVQAKLRGIHPDNIEMIESVQPYRQAPRDQRRHPLRQLTSLSNRDKHHRLTPIGVLCLACELFVVEARNCEATGSLTSITGKLLTPQTEVGSVSIRAVDDVEPELIPGTAMTLDLAFDDTLMPVGALFDLISRYVSEVMHLFEPAFLEAEGRGSEAPPPPVASAQE